MNQINLGIIGLGVMGRNLALNFAEHGYDVAVYNRTDTRTKEMMSEELNEHIHPTWSIEEFVSTLASPRNILLMVKAGEAVDYMINLLQPLLKEGDLIIDAGNSYFKDTIRRTQDLNQKGIYYIGLGVSGGEEGARKGPSLMFGGNHQAYERIQFMFEDIAAKANDGMPCCKFFSEDGAGHFVKMVHNGIEYADMQLIAESVQFFKRTGLFTQEELAEIYDRYNKGKLSGYLIEITSKILREKDEKSSDYLLNRILDIAEQKGTGKWTNLEAIELGVNAAILYAGFNARLISMIKNERKQAADIYPEIQSAKRAIGSNVLSEDVVKKKEAMIRIVENALLVSKIMAYAQGFSLYKKASETYHWTFRYSDIASVFRAGCIIRSVLLEDIMKEYNMCNELDNLLLTPTFAEIINERIVDLRTLVAMSAEGGISIQALSAALSYFDSYRNENSEAAVIQAQRDFFGAHTYQRNDGEVGYFHHEWPEVQ